MSKKNIKDRIGFLCIGQGGCRVGKSLKEMGFTSLFVNSSEGDLEGLKLEDKNIIYPIPNASGCARTRELALQLLQKDYENMLPKIESFFKEKEIVFITFSAGGGTGGGMSPYLCKILPQYLGNITFGAVIILPNINEASRVQYNAIQVLNEIQQASSSLGNIFLLDNNTTEDKLGLNEDFALQFTEYCKIPEISDSEKGDYIDESDAIEVLKEHGVAIISYSNMAKRAEEIINIFNTHSIFAPLEKDKILSYYITSTLEKLDMELVRKTYGIETLDAYIGMRNDANSLLYMNGLSFPKSRIEQMVKKFNENPSDRARVTTVELKNDRFSNRKPISSNNNSGNIDDFLKNALGLK